MQHRPSAFYRRKQHWWVLGVANQVRQPPSHVLDLIQESVITVDIAGHIVQWNSASERLYGLMRDQAIGVEMSELFADFPDCARQGPLGLSLAEVRVSRKAASGKIVLVQVRRHVQYGPTGVPISVTETGTDVTNLNELENALRRWEDRGESMRQASPTGIWELDSRESRKMIARLKASGVHNVQSWLEKNPSLVREMMQSTHISYVCENTIELFGNGDPNAFNAGLASFWRELSYGSYCRSVSSAVAGKSHFTTETVLQDSQGKQFDVYFSATFPTESAWSGKTIIAVTALAPSKRELAALKKSEAFYRGMFMSSSVSAFHLDHSRANQLYDDLKKQGVTDIFAYAKTHPDFAQQVMDRVSVVDVNETSIKLFGAKSRADLLGNSVARYWIPGKLDTLLGVIEAAFNHKTSFTAETPMRAVDGREITVLFTFTASEVIREAGQALLSIVDITDRVRAQNDLVESEANFAHAARISSLGEFATSIVHEVNQPLAAISIYGETSLRWLDRPEPNFEEVRDLTQRMIGDARRASDIIGRIRAMATPQVMPHRRLAVNTLVTDTLTFVRPELRKLGVLEVLELSAGLPDIFGDNIQLQQVLVNLTVNALQALEDSPQPQIFIRTSFVDEMVQLDFADNGPGISEQNAQRLFRSFFTTKKNGVGIGLGICKSIVEAHNGSIVVESPTEGGAHFTVRLPSARSEKR